MADDGSDDGRGFRITLPPIRLPALFPEGFNPAFEPPERVRTAGASPRLLVLLAVLLDAADAAFVLSGVGAVSTAVTTLLGTVLLGLPAFLNLWELLAPAPLAAFPTLSVLALLQFRGELDVLGGGHPEHVEGDPEREG